MHKFSSTALHPAPRMMLSSLNVLFFVDNEEEEDEVGDDDDDDEGDDDDDLRSSVSR
jgi:hypothetical protein